MVLREDIPCSKGGLYGKKGDVVELISDEHGEVLIVQGIDGERFPVRIEKVENVPND